jgi:hypothetical protein
VIVSATSVMAGPHRGGSHFAGMTARGGGGGARPFVGGNRFGNWNGQHWNGQHWNNHNWNGQHWNNHWSNNWNWYRHHHHNNVVFFSDFGFPFWGWWGYPYYYGNYPYGYYGSYGYNYRNGYAYGNGNGYGNGYSNNYDGKVAELQQRLANAGYYHGEIDGIMGSRTHYALRAYRHDHPSGNDNGSGYHQYPTQRKQPYSPPPVTTEPSPSE